MRPSNGIGSPFKWSMASAVRTGKKWKIKKFAALTPLVLLSVIMAAHFGLTDDYLRGHVFEGPFLLPILNFLFLGLISFGVSWLAAKSYLKSGSLSVIMLGSGALAFGIIGISAGWFIYLPDGVNIAVTIFNCGALLYGILNFLSSIAHIGEFPPKADPKSRMRDLGVGYCAVIVVIGAITSASLAGWTPVFFVQSLGPTLIRQFVIGAAIMLLLISGAYLLSIHHKSKSDFSFWYALGLVLIAEGLLGVSLARSVGGIIGWTGRLAQYAGGIFLLMAVLSSLRERSLEDVLSEVFKKPGELHVSMFRNSLDGIILSVHDGPALTANPSACAMLGFDPAQSGQPAIQDIFDTQNTAYRKFRDELADTGKARAELVLTGKAGHHFQVEISAAVFKDSLGKKLEILTFKDISERKRTETALRESEEKFRLIATNIREVIFFQDKELRYVWIFNPADGVQESEVIGRTDVELLPTDEAARITEIKRRVLETGEGTRAELQLSPGGTSRWYDAVYEPCRDSEGRIVGILSYSRDITERKLAEEGLRQLNEDLEKKVAERTELAEARTRQLQALAIELIETEERERRQFAELLHDDLQQMLASARFQLLAVSSELPTHPILVNIIQILEESIAKSRRLSHELSPPVLHHGGLYSAFEWLAAQMDQQFGFKVQLEADKLPQLENGPLKVFVFRAVQELLFNTIKHSGVKSARVQFRSSDGNLEVKVIDTGKGFDKADLDSAEVKTGFGLLSIRERARHMGGHLTIESTLGGGSRFSLTLPINAVTQKDMQKPTEQSFELIQPKVLPGKKELRVLFADDHKVMRQGLIRLISGQPNIKVSGEAANGREAVQLALQLKPDVIVMDISMPEMDGIEATARIKAELPEVRVIGLSMFEDEQAARNMLNAGAEAFVAKTASSAELLKVIYGSASSS